MRSNLAIAMAALTISGLTVLALPGGARALPLITKCGGTLDSNFATNNNRTTVSSTSFVDLHTTDFGITAGDLSGCALVLFTAETSCKGASKADLCYVQALDNGVPMKPAGPQVLDSESQTPSTHAFEWISRGLLKGVHNFTIQVKVGASGTTLVLDSWTLQVQLLAPSKL